jgi:hypothetical protein
VSWIPAWSFAALKATECYKSRRLAEGLFRTAKSEGVIYYGFEPVTNQRQLPSSEWATRCPHLLRFPEEGRGKRVYIALQWEIRKEHGESPWSEIQSELVP